MLAGQTVVVHDDGGTHGQNRFAAWLTDLERLNLGGQRGRRLLRGRGVPDLAAALHGNRELTSLLLWNVEIGPCLRRTDGCVQLYGVWTSDHVPSKETDPGRSALSSLALPSR